MKKTARKRATRDGANEAFDFDLKLNGVLADADARLQKILLEDPFDAASFDGAKITRYEFALGAVDLSREEIDALDINSIVTLTDAQKGRVQIWCDGKNVGIGALLVVDGKLAVRIETFNDRN